VTRAGHALFLGFALGLSRSWGKLFALELSRAFLGLKFRAFALPRSLIFFALFSRSSIFRARTFVLLDFRARNFVLVRIYTAKTGQPGQDTQNRTGRNKTTRTGQQKQDRQKKTGLTGEPGQDSQGMKARTGQAKT
jgi:hypothetical protein